VRPGDLRQHKSRQSVWLRRAAVAGHRVEARAGRRRDRGRPVVRPRPEHH